MNDTLITFVRHGKNHIGLDSTPWHAGPSLNPEGRKQADKTGKYLKHFAFDLVLSSDMNRAAETAKIICKYQKNIKPEKINFCRQLAEHDEIVKFFKDVLKKYKGKRIMIVAHGNVIRACVGAALGFPLHYSPELNSFNCSVTTIAFRASRLKAIFHINNTEQIGEHSFLKRLESVQFISDYSKIVADGAVC